MKTLSRWTLMALLVGAGAPACSGDDSTDSGIPDTGPRDTGVESDAGEPDSGVPDTGPRPDSGVVDSGVGDMNDSFETAVDGRKNTMQGARGVISPALDHDFYFFEAALGEFVRIYTTNTGMADPVITLYDAAFNQVAENDDALPAAGTNSEIVYRVPAAGRYYVEVQDWTEWGGQTPAGSANHVYTLFIRTVNDANPGITIGMERGNDAASAIDAEMVNGVGMVVSVFEEATDVDVYRVVLGQEVVGRRLFVQTLPPGPDGSGATTAMGRVWLTQSTSTTAYARLTLSAEALTFSPATLPGEYLLWVQHPGAAQGANDFYVLKLALSTENVDEVEPNDTLETADVRVLTAGTDNRSNFVLSNVTTTDVDYFRLDLMPGERVSVACGARSQGSGATLSVDLLNGAGMVLANAVETDMLARITQQAVTSSVAYVRLTNTAQSPELTSNFVRCGLFAVP